MTTKEKYQDEVKNQISKGVNFEKDVFLTDRSYFANLAKKYGYRKPKNSYFALGGSFYLCLQRVYNRMKKDGNI